MNPATMIEQISSLTTQRGFYVFLSLGSAKGYDSKVTIDWIEQE
jgi:hypothetical protein